MKPFSNLVNNFGRLVVLILVVLSSLLCSADSFQFDLVSIPANGRAQSMNNNGTIVGSYQSGTLAQQGFILQGSQVTNVTVANLGTPGGTLNGINNTGQIVGWTGATTGFLRNSDGTIAVLAYNAIPFGINDHGDVVGFRYLDTGSTGFIYSNGTFQNLYSPNSMRATPRSINDKGQVVGSYATDPYGATAGFVYSGTSFQMLNGPNGLSINPVFINNNGLIVGTLGDGSGFLLDQGNFTVLKTDGGYNFSPLSINDYGQILGTYYDGANSFTATATPRNPVPEPSTLVLLSSVLVLAQAGHSLRKQKKS